VHHFDYKNGRMFAEDVDLETIAKTVGTPTYVYSRATIERHFRVYDEAFAGREHLICYAMKANSSRAVLHLLAKLGAGADIVSGGELRRALAAGIPANKIVFSGVGKRVDEMADALEARILEFNVESEPELRVLDRIASDRREVARVALRVNPNVDPKTHPYIATGLLESKFGIPIADAPRIADEIKRLHGVRLVGIDCHIGSQLTDLGPFMESLDAVLALVDALNAQDHQIESIDLGGGLGIPYRGETPPLPSELGAAVLARLRGRKERVLLEPGRVIVGNAGILLARVLYVKTSGQKTFVVLDAAMNDLIRPSLYKAHHEILPVTKKSGAPIVADVVGPVCETGDRFAQDRKLEPVEEGDLVALMSAGAYGFAMASTYNSRTLAVEVMVSGAQFEVVRARQSVEALMAGESVPSFLEDRPSAAGSKGDS
jgi:diaminopimelate decarboxylase